jgi:NADPH:quinone reductase-like Zn-dependent oxidoreductase
VKAESPSGMRDAAWCVTDGTTTMATMKAIRMRSRGGPEALAYEDVPRPRAAPGELLIRVHASGITATELTWSTTWATDNGTRELPIPGHELSGKVEEVGPGIADVSSGEEVYALTDFCRDGAQAQYAIALPSEVAQKPASLTFVQAAALPIAALTAWQALFERAQLARGMRVLIHGGAGGVGSLAVQIARWAGAHVIATTSGPNAQHVGALGAESIVDYTATRFEDVVRDVDIVFDAVGGETIARSWPVLVKGGVLVSVVQPPPARDALQFGVRAAFLVVRPDRDQLIRIGQLVDEGKLRPCVESVFPLADGRRAYEHRSGVHRAGKTVIAVD